MERSPAPGGVRTRPWRCTCGAAYLAPSARRLRPKPTRYRCRESKARSQSAGATDTSAGSNYVRLGALFSLMNDLVLSEAELRARGGGKWRKYPSDVLPAWVADMDFNVAPSVQSSLQRFVDRQDYGYGLPGDYDALFEAFAKWM